MATTLSISDLADILAALTEITDPYQLGIQLKVDLAELDTIEKNHSGNIGRQKTEVIKYWLRNSPDASWSTLANALERMGGHANLVETLREKQSNGKSSKPGLLKPDFSFCQPHSIASIEESKESGDDTNIFSDQRSFGICREACEDRNILLLGKMGHGKSTLGNRILNSDQCFKINNRKCPQTCQKWLLQRSITWHKDYKVNVYDHDGLFDRTIPVDALLPEIPLDLNLAIFVLKQGRSFEGELLEEVIAKWKISEISALVITNCDDIPEEQREEMIKQFKKDHPSVAELMGKGILAVGFPDSSHIQPGSELSQRVEDDKKKLRRLIYLCDDIVYTK